MSERYSQERGEAAGGTPDDEGAAVPRDLVSRLLPGVDVALLVRGLEEEAAQPAAGAASAASRRPTDLSPAERELHRVRLDLALGGAARMLQHSINNPLAALLAEAQLLELEPLPEEQRLAAARIVELARRVAAVVRKLDVGTGVAR